MKKIKKRHHKKSTIDKIIIILLIIIFSMLFIFSSSKIVCWFIDNHNTKNNIKEIKTKTKIINDKDSTTIKSTAPKSDPYWDYIKMPLIDVDLNKLKKENPDTVGWLKVEGTNINYPFVQTNNNDYYLTHSFDKKVNYAGWVFMDYRNNATTFDQNTILYAHGRLDTTMFGSLKNILKSNWYNNKDNYVVKLVTASSTSLWQVFSVYKIPTTSDYLTTNFANNIDYESFLNMLKDRSAFNFYTSISTTDKILTLSTCYNEQEKVVMHAKLIKIKDK
jgi:sortase B